MENLTPDPLQVPRFFARAIGILLAALIALFAIYHQGAVPGQHAIVLLAGVGGPLVALLLAASIFLLRNGARWRFLWDVWSYVLVAACIWPLHMLLRSFM